MHRHRSRARSAWLVLAGAGLVASCSSSPATSPQVRTSGGVPGPVDLAMVVLPLASPDEPMHAAVHADTAMVLSISPEQGRTGALLTESGDPEPVSVPGGLSSAVPLSVEDGFAVFGFGCTRQVEGVADACAEGAGSVTFYDLAGTATSQQTLPPVTGTDVLGGGSDGDTGVVVVGPERTWQVTPDSVRVLADRPLGSPCAIPGRGVFTVRPVSSDSERPEDSLDSLSIEQILPEDEETVVLDVPANDDATPFPFCTPGGLIIEDRIFDGRQLTDLAPEPGALLTSKSTIGVTAAGDLLQRSSAASDAETASGTTAWVGLSADRRVALSGGKTWTFVDVA